MTDLRAAPAPSPPQYRTASEPRLRLLIPLVVACGLFMENLDSTILATAIPQMAASLGESPLRLNVAITSYLLSLAVFIPVSGWVADRYGARSVFCSAIAVFTVGSALCGLATSLPMLVVTRVLQGLGGAMMTPVGRLILLKSFPKSQLVTAMSYVTIPALIGPAIGPLVGGFLTTYASWRWIFYINIPIGFLGIGLALRFLENFRVAAAARFDFTGFVLCGIGLASTALGLEYAGRHLISNALEAAILAVAALSLAAYAFYARRTPNPAVDLKIFENRTFRIAVIGGLICRTGLGAVPFLLPLLLQIPFHLTAFQSGSLTFVLALGSMGMKSTSPPILRKFGFRKLLLVNAVIVGLGTMALGLIHADTPHWLIVPGLLVFGFFRSLQFTCMNTLAYADLSSTHLSTGSSVASVTQQLSITFGVAIAATLLSLLIGPGSTPSAEDFLPVFILVGLLPIASVAWFSQLRPEDGNQVSGHRV
ncbi:MAG TPA: DHA2 family efflux MFS transporter permease subunit [Stellaceae bacterium]|nr:DHA2 family efflux MFS transporter permease subunit [Stellaceae bacterium]